MSRRHRNPAAQLSLFGEAPDLEQRPLYAAEAFSGGGLFGLGFVIEGINVGEACEFEPTAVETLAFNLHDDITVCDATQFTPRVPEGGIDIMFGGPPCQPFSALGAGLGVDDPRFLFDEFIRWAKEVQPRVVVLENVRKLLSKDFAWIADRWFEEMAELGYDGALWEVIAADYGTPQLRPRVFLVAWPKGAPWGELLRTPPPPTHAPPDQAEAAGLLPWVAAQSRLFGGCCGGFGAYSCRFLNNLDGFCDTCNAGSNYDMADNEEAAEEGSRRRREKEFPEDHPFFPGSTYLAGTEQTGELSLGDVAFLLKDPSRIKSRHPYVDLAYGATWDPRKKTSWVSPTLTASIAGGAPMGLMLEPGATFEDGHTAAEMMGIRRMTVREAAKLQDVPQWYIFRGPIARKVKDPVSGKRKYIGQYAQVGNGVAVNVARAIGRHILRAFGRQVPQPDSIASYKNAGLWELEPGVDACTSFVQTPGFGYPYDRGAPPEQLTEEELQFASSQRAYNPSGETDARRRSLKKKLMR